MVDKYNPIDFPIKITCEAAATISIDMLTKFQGGLKKLSDKNRDKLSISICKKGFTAPFFVWVHDDIFYLLDGHQRLDTLISMRDLGWEIPELPIAYIEAADIKEAKEKLLVITSQYGEFQLEELTLWLDELDDELTDFVRLVDDDINLEIETDENYGESFTLPDGEKEPFQQMTFTLADSQAEYIKERLSEAKKQIDFDLMDCFGNENGNGNALYCLIKGFVE